MRLHDLKMFKFTSLVLWLIISATCAYGAEDEKFAACSITSAAIGAIFGFLLLFAIIAMIAAFKYMRSYDLCCKNNFLDKIMRPYMPECFWVVNQQHQIIDRGKNIAPPTAEQPQPTEELIEFLKDFIDELFTLNNNAELVKEVFWQNHHYRIYGKIVQKFKKNALIIPLNIDMEKNMEPLLLKAKRFQVLWELTPNAVMFTDHAGVILAANAIAEQILPDLTLLTGKNFVDELQLYGSNNPEAEKVSLTAAEDSCMRVFCRKNNRNYQLIIQNINTEITDAGYAVLLHDVTTECRAKNDLQMCKSILNFMANLKHSSYFMCSPGGNWSKLAGDVPWPPQSNFAEMLKSWIHPDDWSNFVTQYKNFEHRKCDQIEIRYRGGDQENSQHYIVYFVRGALSCSPEALLAVNLEVTDTYASQFNLMQEKTILNAVLEQLPCAVFIKDIQNSFKILKTNTAFCRLSNCTGSEVLGRNSAELYPADVAAKVQKDDEIAAAANLPVTFTENMVCNNLPYCFKTKKSVFSFGDRRYLLEICEDITELHDCKMKLADTESILKMILDCSYNIIIGLSLTENAQIVCWNKVAAQVIGLPTEEVMNRNFAELPTLNKFAPFFNLDNLPEKTDVISCTIIIDGIEQKYTLERLHLKPSDKHDLLILVATKVN